MSVRWAALCIVTTSLVGCPSPEESGDLFPAGEPELRVEVEPPRGDAADTIELTLTIPDNRAAHYFEVQAVVPTEGEDEVDLMMPVWTPGSYLVREYARNVEGFVAADTDGNALPWHKTTKNRWTVEAGGQNRIIVRYRVYAGELSVRTPYLDDELALVVAAGLFLTRAEDHARPHDLRIAGPPSEWRAVTSLTAHPSGETRRYLARDYDELVDSPVVLGEAEVSEMSAGGAEHILATFGDTRFWDQARAAQDVEALVRTQQAFWGVVPYPSYVFLNVLTEGGSGGLEHERSTLMLASVYATRDDDTYHDWLGLVSHEFFHTWNGKRLRPVELGPFDYEREVHTRSLWVVEGITSYYDDVLMARAGILDADQYLERLTKQVQSVQTTPGRQVQPLADSSFDAWIKYYRWDENSVNSSISYYRKGAVVGFLLDATIRKATGGQATLDDVMRRAYELHSGERGYNVAQFRAIVSEIARTDMSRFFELYVDGTAELDFGPALEVFGLRFEETDDEEDREPQLGVETRVIEGRVMLSEVRRDTPASTAGLAAGDELIAIDERRVTPSSMEVLLDYYEPGNTITTLVSRRGRLREVPVTLGGEQPEPTWQLVRVRAPTAGQRESFRRWIAARATPVVAEPATTEGEAASSPNTMATAQAVPSAGAPDRTEAEEAPATPQVGMASGSSAAEAVEEATP